MITYTIHEPYQRHSSELATADNLMFIKEGFSWPAFLAPPWWLIYHRMWLELFIYAAAIASLSAGLFALGVKTGLIVWMILLANFLFGFEANNLLRWALERAGNFMLATVNGKSRIDCERRFFDLWLPGLKKTGTG